MNTVEREVLKVGSQVIGTSPAAALTASAARSAAAVVVAVAVAVAVRAAPARVSRVSLVNWLIG